MSKYTPEQKAEALRILDETGSVFAASRQSGVSERTLFRWQRERTLPPPPQEKTQLPPPPPPPLSFPNDPELEEALREQAAAADSIIDDVLDQLLKDVQVLSKRIRHNFDQAPPVSQIMALTRLLDRVIKLDARKPRLESNKRKVYLIRYQYPDGTIHKVPPWYDGDEDDADDPNWSPIGGQWRRD
ncbi:MAG TPA: transposase [Oceanobacillus sp.]|nr:transposase [Oceanobacillus sp.]